MVIIAGNKISELQKPEKMGPRNVECLLKTSSLKRSCSMLFQMLHVSSVTNGLNIECL